MTQEAHFGVLSTQQEEFASQEVFLLILKINSYTLVVLTGGVWTWREWNNRIKQPQKYTWHWIQSPWDFPLLECQTDSREIVFTAIHICHNPPWCLASQPNVLSCQVMVKFAPEADCVSVIPPAFVHYNKYTAPGWQNVQVRTRTEHLHCVWSQACTTGSFTDAVGFVCWASSMKASLRPPMKVPSRSEDCPRM